MMSEIIAIVTEVERMGSAEAAGMRECSMAKAHMAAAHMAAAKSAAMSAAAAAPAVSTAMGQRRDRRTGYQGRRRGQRYHRPAHRDVSSVCCDQRQLSAGTFARGIGWNTRPQFAAASETTMGIAAKILK
jgi:hypothetical protein